MPWAYFPVGGFILATDKGFWNGSKWVRLLHEAETYISWAAAAQVARKLPVDPAYRVLREDTGERVRQDRYINAAHSRGKRRGRNEKLRRG